MKLSRKSLTKKLSFGLRRSKKSKDTTMGEEDRFSQLVEDALHIISDQDDLLDDHSCSSTATCSSKKQQQQSKVQFDLDQNQMIETELTLEDYQDRWLRPGDYFASSLVAKQLVRHADSSDRRDLKQIANIIASHPSSDYKDIQELSSKEKTCAALINDEYRGLEHVVCPKLKQTRHRYHNVMQECLEKLPPLMDSLAKETLIAKRSMQLSQASKIFALVAAQADAKIVRGASEGIM
jgi:hypothetical protein